MDYSGIYAKSIDDTLSLRQWYKKNSTVLASSIAGKQISGFSPKKNVFEKKNVFQTR